MQRSKSLLLLVALACIALLGIALYLQIVEEMLPCPLCIIQRYLFAAIALICIIFAFLPPRAAKTGAGLGLLAALGGVGTAGWHLWVQAHPGTSCGIDPLETSLNNVPTANLFPLLFKADGLCATPYPFLGLSIPQWSLICFVLIAAVLASRAFKRG
ncbi:dihydrolipoamide acyltransferase [Herbaspirillum hiltneri N3]|uniref:Disulfide bond formation protein B n=1 Tax=Herbaspirillum hiltneri N3 TaxID=1262470 RepID=A0ABN4HTD0_9BURK|nr:disulfide bond formation protein B [Herbaspirillum hiltneri]AKZ61774.1 dihydrolipoamide acyltransferase [Herbaspirillum hiltneri N3]